MDIADIKWLGWLYLRLGPAFAILYYAAVILFYAGIVEHEKNEAWSSLMWRAFKHTSLLMLLVAPVAAGEVAPFLPWWLFALGQPHTGVVTHHMALQVVDIFWAVYIFFLLLLFAMNRGIISNKDKG